MKPQSLTLFAVPEVDARDARVHAMKNCLSVIIAVAHLCQRDMSGENLVRFERLKTATARLRALIEADLRPDAEDSFVRPAEVRRACVESMVRHVAERLADRAEIRGVTVLVECGGGEIIGDQEALLEALFNVAANAVEATPAGGGVFLTTCETSDGDQHWIVQDTGCGIPADQLPELGRLFCSRRKGGSGLGLALAQEAVARHGGLLRVESAPGSGTTVSVWLPRDPGPI